eukprot:10152955-Alexandrium_andersonii.AAC.1
MRIIAAPRTPMPPRRHHPSTPPAPSQHHLRRHSSTTSGAKSGTTRAPSGASPRSDPSIKVG